MPKFIDFFTQFHAPELLITLGIILLIVGIRERFNFKKWLGFHEEKIESFKSKE